MFMTFRIKPVAVLPQSLQAAKSSQKTESIAKQVHLIE